MRQSGAADKFHESLKKKKRPIGYPQSLGYTREARSEMIECSSRFGDVDRRTMWSATYRRIFRSVYPQETRERLENLTRRNFTERDPFQAPPREIFQNKTENYTDFCGTNERQDSKRVSIDESEARSMLRRKASEREATLEDVSTDDDVGEYIRDVMKREFRGECDQVTVRQLNHHPEAVFNKTLKLVGPEKTVYVHLRNRVKTSCKQEDQGTVEEQPTELFWPEDQYARRSKSSQEREELHRHKVNDSVAHTKASSWTGPHYPVPRTTSVLSWRESSRNYNYHDEYAYRMGTQVQRMIDELIWRINRGDPLDREDLHALKEIHLARVAPDEAELFSLLQYRRGQDEQHISHLREILEKWYLTYEDLLEAAQPFNSITAIIAHLILLADAYFFHARIVASESVQRKLYRRSIGIYNDLLNQAKRSLHSTDVSLLSVVERISQILRESHIQEPALVLEITTILDKAETGLMIEQLAILLRGYAKFLTSSQPTSWPLTQENEIEDYRN